MTPLFRINFRREAYQREMARVRRRMTMLGIWVSYFGLVAVIIGLFVLNGVALHRRVRLLEQRIAVFESRGPQLQPWEVTPSELPRIEQALHNPRLWRARLARLAALTPPNVLITSLALNPDNVASQENRLEIRGTLRPRPGEDRMQGIMAFTAVLQKDPGFGSGYQTVRLAQSLVAEGAGGEAEFKIECR